MTALFQQLPSVDKILKTPQGLQLITEFGHTAVVAICRELLMQARQFIQKNNQLPEYFSNFDYFLVKRLLIIELLEMLFSGKGADAIMGI